MPKMVINTRQEYTLVEAPKEDISKSAIIIIYSTSEIMTEFQKYHGWLMKNAKISPDNMDYRSQLLRVAKRNERPAVPAGSNTGLATPLVATGSKMLETGRQYTDLGECNIEFRHMSNAPDALSVGFYNPATKRLAS
jgi:hypothetical protein